MRDKYAYLLGDEPVERHIQQRVTPNIINRQLPMPGPYKALIHLFGLLDF